MKMARIRLVLAAAAFLGWLGWLGLAVAQKERPTRISRAQLTEANFLIVAEVLVGEDGLPATQVKVVSRLSPQGPNPPDTIEVANLAAAAPPGKSFPGAGTYLLPLVIDITGTRFRVAGLPRSPGFEGQAYPERPNIYPWSDDVQKQLRLLGYSF